MNNKEASELLKTNSSIRAASDQVIRRFALPDTELSTELYAGRAGPQARAPRAEKKCAGRSGRARPHHNDD